MASALGRPRDPAPVGSLWLPCCVGPRRHEHRRVLPELQRLFNRDVQVDTVPESIEASLPCVIASTLRGALGSSSGARRSARDSRTTSFQPLRRPTTRRPGRSTRRHGCSRQASRGSSPFRAFSGRIPRSPTGWHDGTPILYFGTAGSVRARIRALVRFGAGEPVGHWGGGYLWQLEYCEAFRVAWREVAKPRDVERDLLAGFAAHFGGLPFANIVG